MLDKIKPRLPFEKAVALIELTPLVIHVWRGNLSLLHHAQVQVSLGSDDFMWSWFVVFDGR